MKKNAQTLSVILMSIFIGFTYLSCDSKDDDDLDETSFSEYDLSGTSCKWIPAGERVESELIMINSSEELDNYITYTEKNDRPDIDFKKHTLLLARGEHLHLIKLEYINFEQAQNGHYVFTVNLQPYLSSVITNWWAPIIVKKLKDKGKIELVVTEKNEHPE